MKTNKVIKASLLSSFIVLSLFCIVSFTVSANFFSFDFEQWAPDIRFLVSTLSTVAIIGTFSIFSIGD